MKHKEFFNDKIVKFRISPDAHKMLRIKCFESKITMSALFEELAQRLISDDPTMLGIVDDVYHAIRNRKLQKLSESDTESVFELLEMNDPFKGGDNE